MADYGGLRIHPVADLFPLIEGEEFDLLVADIAEAGLQEPIILAPDGQTLVDGRNRYRACEKAGREHTFRTLSDQYTEERIIQLIISANLRRRHLDVGQRAMVAVEIEKAYAAEARPGTRTDLLPNLARGNGGSRARAAKDVGVSNGAVQQAKRIAQVAPDLAERVRRGGQSLNDAYKQARQRERAAPSPEPAPAKPSPVMLTLRTHTGEAVPYPEPRSRATFNETRGDGISWAAWSWNPVTGCLHGCVYCYARDIATNELYKAGFPAGFTPLFHQERLDAPANTAIPAAHRGDEAWRRVFVCSMADLYGRWVPDEWIAKVHAAMLDSPEWQYILLTKFPARYVGLDLPTGAWVGTSVDEQKRVRIAEDAFRKIDGVTVKWLSLEPLLEPLQFDDLSMFDWVVIGAQTETRQPDGTVPAFSPPAEWVVKITAQALEAGCKVHWKPNLRINPGMRWLNQYPSGRDG
jgi:protein gp37/ParB-like chromosome segregation protein Spo0J